MKKIIVLAIFSSILAYMIHGCADIGNQAPPASPDTALVSYNDDIQPLFDEFCATPACHGAAFPPNGLNLTAHDSVMTTGIHAPVVIEFYPDSSLLVKKLRGTAPEESKMPPPGNPAPATSDTSMIVAWIAQGAQDN